MGPALSFSLPFMGRDGEPGWGTPVPHGPRPASHLPTRSLRDPPPMKGRETLHRPPPKGYQP
ncbi:hypothetical protein GCM10007859_25330 [Brevundimonas denitrificans]|uniref:Uncharacterized protein n=1 Tax=Brevundimonas denitrificans TaxID=1443434 RepID=A0ABQ6BM30_9CAUL|nr:hypothetical protein GCM10007859_25330 [Brevundimonas denitrificans]